jgi:hypothetical protein
VRKKTILIKGIVAIALMSSAIAAQDFSNVEVSNTTGNPVTLKVFYVYPLNEITPSINRKRGEVTLLTTLQIPIKGSRNLQLFEKDRLGNKLSLKAIIIEKGNNN